MSKKDYIAFAGMLEKAYQQSDHETWVLIYDTIYTPLVNYLKSDNPRFDMTKFSWAVAHGADDL